MAEECLYKIIKVNEWMNESHCVDFANSEKHEQVFKISLAVDFSW